MSDDPAFRALTRDAAASRPGPPPGARLRVVHPVELRWVLELGLWPLELGRIAVEGGPPGLANGTVSRRHFEVRWDVPLRCHVGRDLGSHNGSRVNGQELGRSVAILRDGSVIQLGDVSLVYEALPAHAVTMPSLAASRPDDDPLVPGHSPAIAALVDALERASRERTPVLLCGEAGTGKEHIARALHRRSGRPGPFVALAPAPSPPPRASQPAFGRGRAPDRLAPVLLGAPTGSTLFVGEIAELAPSQQLELLRALDRGEAGPDVRVVAATQHDPAERVAAGRFRRELHAHLARGQLVVPPLRERRGDVLVWLERLHAAWLERRPRHPAQTLALSPEAAEQLLLHAWPGNLHALERLVHALASDPNLPRPIPLPRLPAWLRGGNPDVPTQPVSGPPVPRPVRGLRA